MSPCLADTVEVKRNGFEFRFETGTILSSKHFEAHEYLTKDLPGQQLYQTPDFLYQRAQNEIQFLHEDAELAIVDLSGCPVIIKLSKSKLGQTLVLAVYPPGPKKGVFERVLFLEHNLDPEIRPEDFERLVSLFEETFKWTLEQSEK